MYTNKNKDLILLGASAAILVAANIAIWMAEGKGSIGAVENLPLWRAFIVLNMVSILWAISQLGLQPLVVAASYVGGALLAFQGACGMADVNVAELTTAGATYGAFGALAVGNVTTRVRLAFFNSRQVPVVFIILALLIFDGILNSQVSQAGWSVVLNALVVPFAVGGGVVGLVWLAVSKAIVNRKVLHKEKLVVANDAVAETDVGRERESDLLLMMEAPEHALGEDDCEDIVVAMETDESLGDQKPLAHEDTILAMQRTVEDIEDGHIEDDNFFPLEIDKRDDDFILPPSNDGLINIATMVAEKAAEESLMHTELVPQSDEPAELPADLDVESGYSIGLDVEEKNMEKTVLETAFPLPVAKEPDIPAEPAVSGKTEPTPKDGERDWLSSHLDLLKKIK